MKKGYVDLEGKTLLPLWKNNVSSPPNLNNKISNESQIIQQQDQVLSSMSSKLEDLQVIALNVGNEIDSQKKDLEDVNHDVDVTNSRLKKTMIKIDRVLHDDSDKIKYACIGILVLIILVLLIIIIYGACFFIKIDFSHRLQSPFL